MRPEALTINMDDKTIEYRLSQVEIEFKELRAELKTLLEKLNAFEVTLSSLTIKLENVVLPGTSPACEEHRNRLTAIEEQFHEERKNRETLAQSMHKAYGIGAALLVIANIAMPILIAKLIK